MGLRRLNGHAVDYRVKGPLPKGKAAAREAMEDRKKRLIVEFAIENANVVQRRSAREREGATKPKSAEGGAPEAKSARGKHQKDRIKKRKLEETDANQGAASGKRMKKDGKGAVGQQGTGAEKTEGKDRVRDEKVAQRSRIIQKKRIARRAKKAGKA
jgi:nucleolar protein 4